MTFCFNRKMRTGRFIYEKSLKHFDKLPLPKVTGIKMFVDLYPDKQQAFVKSFVSLKNKTNRPVEEMLLDADGDYRLFH